MNFIRMVFIFSCLCLLLHFGHAVLHISSRSQTRDRSGKLVQSRRLDFSSDFAAPIFIRN